MVIIGLLVVLFALFFLIRKHTGPTTLAMIAGYAVYQSFSGQILDFIRKNTGNSLPEPYILAGICVAFVIVFPIILYLRSYSGGVFGVMRVVQAAVLSASMTLLVAPVITNFDFLTFDALSRQVVDLIKNYEGIIVVITVVAAYFDVLMYRG